eukprot:Sspe_Gene.115389::Locus_102677_Transcript_1_1_Confidence_1.000_Length_1200::g.115389::m.115389
MMMFKGKGCEENVAGKGAGGKEYKGDDAGKGKRKGGKGRPLLVDGLNFTHTFFPTGSGCDFWRFSEAKEKVRAFVESAGRRLVVFLDDHIATDETWAKWRSRREAEVIEEKRTVPTGVTRMMAEVFSSCGVEVHFSKEADNDDTIASFAEVMDGDILSADRDFFRYRNASYTVYRSYFVRKGRLYLLKHKFPYPKEGVTMRDIILPPPATSTSPTSGIDTAVETGEYIRGVATPLTKLKGNTFSTVRPLREALYHHLGTKKAVRECIPGWNPEQGEVTWNWEEVHPDPTLSNLLTDPVAAVRWALDLRGERPAGVADLAWGNHVFSLLCATLELVGCAMGIPLYDAMLKYTSKTLVTHPASTNDASPPYSQP